MTRQLRELTLIGATGAVRTEQFEGREHLVVPVVALMEGVIHAVNANSPEFVPGELLRKSAHTWNGRPCLIGHAVRHGQQVSANDPTILAAQRFGTIFACQTRNKRMGLEAWIDPARLEALGQHALLADLRAGKPIEVSVGAHVRTLAEKGIYNGRAYTARWAEAYGDHLAFLPGGRGACSVEMGCGTHRAASYRYGDRLEALANPEGINQYTKGAASAMRDRMARDPATKRYSMLGAVEADRAGHAFDTRNFGNWVVPPGEEDDGDYDWKQPTQETHDTMAGHIAAVSKQFPQVKLGYTVEEKNYIRVHAEPKVSARSKVNERKPENVIKSTHKLTGLSNPEGVNQYSSGSALKPGDAKPGMRVSHPTLGNGTVVKNAGPHLKQYLRGATVTTKKKTAKETRSLGERLRALLSMDPEEQAELITYQTLKELHDQMGGTWDAAQQLIDALIAAEEADTLDNPSDEDAEETLEQAQLSSLRTLLYGMSGVIGGMLSLVSEELSPSPSGQMTGMEGKTISAKTMRSVQAAHDAAHVMHDQTTGLGAACNGMKLLASKYEDCPACDGTGKTKDGSPCTTCDGEGQTLKAAETAIDKETDMEKKDVIKSLTACPCSGFTEADIKMLEAFPIERLQALQATADARKKSDDDLAKAKTDLKAAQDANANIETRVKALEAPKTEEEFLKIAPESFRTLVASDKARTAARKEELVGTLTTAQSAYTPDELKALELPALEKLALVAKVPVTDYSGQGTPMTRAAGQGAATKFTPPNGYEAGIKALQEKGAVKH